MLGRSWKFVILVAALALTACSGGDQTSGGDDATAGTSTVTLRDDEFVPANPTVSVGDVQLVNEGDSPHTFTIDGETVDVEVAPGETASTTIDLAPGTYTLFCEFHRSSGMEGTLTVEG